MDLYILDEILRRTELIDKYESLIWTERFDEIGDFELLILADRGTIQLFPIGVRLAIKKSKRVMVVETIDHATSAEGRAVLKISGRSLESLLEDRVNRNGFASDMSVPQPWIITNEPATVARLVFNTLCRNNTIIPTDNIPFLVPGDVYTYGTIPEPSELVAFRFEVDTLYNTLRNICTVYHLGFRLVKNLDTSELYFDVYAGNNRTSAQTEFPAVIFSPELDNLTNTSELTSSATYKNVAYVFAPNGSAIVYAPNIDPTVEGFERRVLMVKADEIETAAGETLTAELEQKGQEELAKHRVLFAFDGEIPEFGSYQYDEDYILGDIVEKRNVDGAATHMRVTEQIFISDGEGERAYPTLTIDSFVTPGSWYGWPVGQVWDDAPGYWDEA